MLFIGCLKQSQALPFIWSLCMENTFCDQCMLIRNLISLAYSDFPQESIIISSKSNIHHFNMWEILELAHRVENCQNTFFEIPAFWLINKPNYIWVKVQNTFFYIYRENYRYPQNIKNFCSKNDLWSWKPNFIRMEFSLKRKSWNEIPLFIY